jgi:hypothetical protein
VRVRADVSAILSTRARTLQLVDSREAHATRILVKRVEVRKLWALHTQHVLCQVEVACRDRLSGGERAVASSGERAVVASSGKRVVARHADRLLVRGLTRRARSRHRSCYRNDLRTTTTTAKATA